MLSFRPQLPSSSHGAHSPTKFCAKFTMVFSKETWEAGLEPRGELSRFWLDFFWEPFKRASKKYHKILPKGLSNDSELLLFTHHSITNSIGLPSLGCTEENYNRRCCEASFGGTRSSSSLVFCAVNESRSPGEPQEISLYNEFHHQCQAIEYWLVFPRYGRCIKIPATGHRPCSLGCFVGVLVYLLQTGEKTLDWTSPWW